LAHLDAKAKAQAKAKAKATKHPFHNFWTFYCKFNEKHQFANGGSQANSTRSSFINPKWLNTCIPTGLRNSLLVVALDVKDDGLKEFKQYIQEQGKPNTLHVITPTGGEHYYFIYAHPDPATNQMIKSFLNNAFKFRGKGIDIRSEGGYTVGRRTSVHPQRKNLRGNQPHDPC
jgi:hypothetical protein